MDKKREMEIIIEKKLADRVKYGKVYYYPQIPYKVKSKALKYFDPNMNINNIISDESHRVAKVAHNSKEILDDIDRKFEFMTGLNGLDVAFLFLAISLQCARIYLVDNISKIEKAGQKNRNEKFLHNVQENIFEKFNTNGELNVRKYYAPLDQIITGIGVPYDTTRYLDKNYKLFKGANHRFATLGHDPILGLIVGTANILTNTITCVDKTKVTTNHVVYDENLKNPKIGEKASNLITLKKAAERLDGDVVSVVAAIIKQIIHIGTDLYTPCGIQLFGANIILSKKEAEILTKYIDTGDIVKISASADLSNFINIIINTMHMLTYDKS